jgi:hypothetical protein
MLIRDDEMIHPRINNVSFSSKESNHLQIPGIHERTSRFRNNQELGQNQQMSIQILQSEKSRKSSSISSNDSVSFR